LALAITGAVLVALGVVAWVMARTRRQETASAKPLEPTTEARRAA
jgi:hypothetical protein